MIDMSDTVEPKSDQLNADDLIAGPRVITIREIKKQSGDQPISIFFEGDNGKPFKPCKLMRRILIKAWGLNANLYVGRSMEIYNEPDVYFGSIKTGGVRIKAISHIDKPFKVLLTISKGKRKVFNFAKLEAPAPDTSLDGAITAIGNAQSMDEIKQIWIDNKSLQSIAEFTEAKNKRKSELEGVTSDEPAI